MLSIPLSGGLPLAAAPAQSIATAAGAATTALATTATAATPAQGPSYTDIFKDDTPVGTRPGIQDYFDHGQFPLSRSVAENHALATAAAAALYYVPLAQVGFRMARGLLNLIPGTKPAVFNRTPEAALSDPKWYDQFNEVTGLWQQIIGPWCNLAAPGVAIYIGLDIYYDLFRILSCYSFDVVLGLGALSCFLNVTRANKAYLGVRFPTLKKIVLGFKARRDAAARRELNLLGHRILTTARQRRHMMGLFNYQPTKKADILPGSLQGSHIA